MDKIAVAQTTSSGNWRENIEKAKQYIKKATEEEAVMIIFPEYFMNYIRMLNTTIQKRHKACMANLYRQ